MRRFLIVVVLIVAAGAATAVVIGRNRAKPEEAAPVLVPVEVAVAEVGEISRAVEVSGTVSSERTAEVVAKISGRVARVLVADGARVGAGQALVELESADQRLELAQAEAAASAAEARLALVERGARPQERQVVENAVAQAQAQVKAAETQVALAQATVRTAEDNLRRHEQLLREGAIAQAQVDQARLQVDQARAQLRAAQAQVEIARTAVDSAGQQLEIVQAGARDEEVRAARAQLEQARAAVSMVRRRLANTVIRAPFAGRVVGLGVSVGDYVVSGDFAGRSGYVAQVYDDRAMEVEVKVGERDIGLIRKGQPILLHLEGGSGDPVEATVHLITPAADPASRAVTVKLRLGSITPGTVPGIFARGEIVIERRVGVLLVPRAAVLDGDSPAIRVVTGDTVQVRPVMVGLSRGDRVEIRSGLVAGEQFVVLGPERFEPGTRVKVVNR